MEAVIDAMAWMMGFAFKNAGDATVDCQSGDRLPGHGYAIFIHSAPAAELKPRLR
jgi:hypothetical protein